MTSVQADDQGVALAKRLAEARSNSKAWATHADELKDALMTHMKHLAGTSDDSADVPETMTASGAAGVVDVVKISTAAQRRTDYKQARADHPTAIPWDNYEKVSSVTTVRVTNVGQ